MRTSRQSSCIVSENSFRIDAGMESTGDVPFEWIERIEAYKRDELTTDLVCFDITYRMSEGKRIAWVHEEMPGFAQLNLALQQRLPGLEADWFSKVAQPAFAENRRTILMRSPNADE